MVFMLRGADASKVWMFAKAKARSKERRNTITLVSNLWDHLVIAIQVPF